jgi:predicted PurR-regulated permease PerM
LIWVPWTIYLFAVGSPAKATIFLVCQLVIVGGIDNILKPLLIEGSVKMHTLLVFFSILAGLAISEFWECSSDHLSSPLR